MADLDAITDALDHQCLCDKSIMECDDCTGEDMEKRVAELEAENKKLASLNADYVYIIKGNNKRISELEVRLEITPGARYDGIDSRDTTIHELERDNAKLRADIEQAIRLTLERAKESVFNYGQAHSFDENYRNLFDYAAEAIDAIQVSEIMDSIGKSEKGSN